MSRSFACTLNLSGRQLSHFGDLAFSCCLKTCLFGIGFCPGLFLNCRNLRVEVLKTLFYLGEFSERQLPLFLRSLEFSLNSLTSRTQSFTNRLSKASMQVQPTGNKQSQVDELPQFQTRIVPPWILSGPTELEEVK